MSSKADGLATAIDSMPVDKLDDEPAGQDDLFGGLGPALVPTHQNDPDVVRTGRPGRPKGAKNKSTKEWSAFVLSRYQSPLIFLAETYSRPVVQLAGELACDPLEAFKVQCAAAGKLAEYVHQKQPVAVQVDQKSAGTLIIQTGLPGDERPAAGVLGDPEPPEKTVENQQLTYLSNKKSDKGKSDDP